ncbi:MAG: hypothetical protein U5N58_00845 [Actinomycetota bacterium]|nr:hypothetical protein [Actinomycetota bacterium]
MARVTGFDDLEPQYIEELAFMGIESIDDLLKLISSEEGILYVEKNTHIDHHLLQSWPRDSAGKNKGNQFSIFWA